MHVACHMRDMCEWLNQGLRATAVYQQHMMSFTLVEESFDEALVLSVSQLLNDVPHFINTYRPRAAVQHASTAPCSRSKAA